MDDQSDSEEVRVGSDMKRWQRRVFRWLTRNETGEQKALREEVARQMRNRGRKGQADA